MSDIIEVKGAKCPRCGKALEWSDFGQCYFKCDEQSCKNAEALSAAIKTVREHLKTLSHADAVSFLRGLAPTHAIGAALSELAPHHGCTLAMMRIQEDRTGWKARAEKAEAEIKDHAAWAEKIMSDPSSGPYRKLMERAEKAEAALAAYTTGEPSEKMMEAGWNAYTVARWRGAALRKWGEVDEDDRQGLRAFARAVLSCGRPEGWVAVKREDLEQACHYCMDMRNPANIPCPTCSIGLALKGGE